VWLFWAVTTSQISFAGSAQEITGMWTFVSSINEQDGKRSDTYGPGATGVMVLDASGRYSITIIAADLPKFASNNRASATAEESKAVVAKSNAHFGTYSVNAGENTITFKIESATFPNWNGTVQKRTLVVRGGDLQYAVAASSAGGSSVVTWKRAK
jgi:hypothetical protein